MNGNRIALRIGLAATGGFIVLATTLAAAYGFKPAGELAYLSVVVAGTLGAVAAALAARRGGASPRRA